MLTADLVYPVNERSVFMARKKNNEERAKVIQITSKKEVNSIARNIRKKREELGWEQKDLANKLGVAPTTICNWETGYSKPSVEMLAPLSNILGITLYRLFDMKEPSIGYSAREQKMMSNYSELSDDHKIAVDNLIYNLRRAEARAVMPKITKLTYFHKHLAAGVGDPTDIYDAGEPMYLYSTELIDRADYVFTVGGESMEPEYHNGDMVLVRKAPECGDIRPCEVGAFMIHNETFIKEYQKDGLHSYNKKYSTIKGLDEYGAVFMGKVIGLIDEGDIASDYDTERYINAYENDVPNQED